MEQTQRKGGRGGGNTWLIFPASSPTIQNRTWDDEKTDARTFVFSVCAVLLLVNTTVASYIHSCRRTTALVSLLKVFLWIKHIPFYKHNIKRTIKGFIIAFVWHGLLFCSQYRVMFVKNDPPALNCKDKCWKRIEFDPEGFIFKALFSLKICPYPTEAIK